MGSHGNLPEGPSMGLCSVKAVPGRGKSIQGSEIGNWHRGAVREGPKLGWEVGMGQYGALKSGSGEWILCGNHEKPLKEVKQENSIITWGNNLPYGKGLQGNKMTDRTSVKGLLCN